MFELAGPKCVAYVNISLVVTQVHVHVPPYDDRTITPSYNELYNRLIIVIFPTCDHKLCLLLCTSSGSWDFYNEASDREIKGFEKRGTTF